MHPFTTPRLRRVDEVDAEFLKFELTPQQLARLPEGKTIVFRKSTHPKKGKGYRQFVSRAEYTSSEPGRRGRAVAIATKLLGVIWDDDPEWIYETNKSKSSIKARRVAAERRTSAAREASVDQALRIFDAPLTQSPVTLIAEDVPALLFDAAAVLCAARELTDPGSVADNWNANLAGLRKLLHNRALKPVTPEAVRRIYASLDTQARTQGVFCAGDFLPEALRRNPARRPMPARDRLPELTDMTLCSEDLAVGAEMFARTTIRFEDDAWASAKDLISCLNVEGALVTLEATLTAPQVAQQITRKRALYLLAVDERHAELCEAVRSAFAAADPALFDSPNPKGRIAEGCDAALVRRRLFTLPADRLPQKLLKTWKGLAEGSIVAVSTEAFPPGHAGQKLPVEDLRLFITSLPNWEARCDAWLAESVRRHWSASPFAADMLWSRDAMLVKHAAYLDERAEFAEFGESIFERLEDEDALEEKLLSRRTPEDLREKLADVEYGLRLLSRIFRG